MTDYSELAKRLRASELWTRHERDGFRPDGTPFEAADALEAQAKVIAEKDTRISELENGWLDEAKKMCARIAELEAALKTCADELEVWIDELYSVGSVLPEHKLRYKRNIESVRTARAALKGERK